jgi:hypothetical protein
MLRRGAPLLALALIAACGTDAVGVDACRQIEEARCRRAPVCCGVYPQCGIDLTSPLHSDDDVTACIRFYDDACQHGLVNTQDPGSVAVKQCVAAINAADCTTLEGQTYVLHPELEPSCSFLTPNPVDAGIDSPPDVVEAAADAATE